MPSAVSVAPGGTVMVTSLAMLTVLMLTLTVAAVLRVSGFWRTNENPIRLPASIWAVELDKFTVRLPPMVQLAVAATPAVGLVKAKAVLVSVDDDDRPVKEIFKSQLPGLRWTLARNLTVMVLEGEQG